MKKEESPSLHSLCHWQTTQCHLDAVRRLKDPMTSLDSLDRNGRTALHVAVINKNARMVELLLQSGANKETPDRTYHYTPLFEAVIKQSESCLNLLLEAGASVNAQDVRGNSVLHTAVRQGSPMVGLLVDRGASVVCPDSRYGRTPIHIAAELGATEILETFLQKCPRGANIKDRKGMTPLHFAAERGHRECCRVLLRHGASTSAKNRLNETALHIAVRNCYLLTCQVLLSYEHDIDNKDNNGFTPLIRITVCKKFDAEKVLRLVLEHNPDLNATCPNGETGLHHAVKGGSQEKCRILVEAGVDCNIQNKHGMTPLHLAAKRKLPECCAAILRVSYDEIFLHSTSPDFDSRESLRGAERYSDFDGDRGRLSLGVSTDSIQDTDRYTSKKKADANIKDNYDKAPLHYALEKQSVECCLLLIKARANISLISSGMNRPLHLAAAAGMERVCSRLLAKGASAKEENDMKETPLHLAAKAGSLACCRLIYRSGANCNAQDKDGMTPLHHAVKIGADDCCRFFLAKRVNILRNSSGRTPLHIAAANGHRDCCELLTSETSWQMDVMDCNGYTPLFSAFENKWDDIFAFLLMKVQHRTSREHHRSRKDSLRNAKASGAGDLSRKGSVAELHANKNKMSNILSQCILERRSKAVEGIMRSECWGDALAPTPAEQSNFRLLIIHYPELAKIVLDNCVLSRPSCKIFLFYYLDDTFIVPETATTPDFRKISSTSFHFYSTLLTRAWGATRERIGRVLGTRAGLAFDKVCSAHDWIWSKFWSVVIFPSDFGSVDAGGSAAEDLGLPERPAWCPYTPEGWLRSSATLRNSSEKTWRNEHPLSLMAKHKRLDLLKHPLCQRFVTYKWEKYVWRVFYALFLMPSLFVVVLSIYGTMAYDWDCVLQEFNVTRDQLCNGEGEGQGEMASDECLADGNTAGNGPMEVLATLKESQINLNLLRKLAWLMLFLKMGLETQKLHHLRRSRLEKTIQVACYVTSAVFLYDWTECSQVTGVREDLQWSCGSVSVMLAWFDLILMLGTIPTFSVFVFMINDFLRFMLKLFVIVLLQVIAFSFAFHMLLRGRASFKNLPRATMKIVTMMLGDLGYDDLFNNTERPLPYPTVSNLVLVYFLVLMVIGMINILTNFPQEALDKAKKQTELMKMSRPLNAVLEMDSKFPLLRRRYTAGWVVDGLQKEDEVDSKQRKDGEEGSESDEDASGEHPRCCPCKKESENLLLKILNEVNALNENLEERRYFPAHRRSNSARGSRS
ncbi:uncharacterized protein LOC122243691 isoform X2 [Penaeus japonicus]|uniref:uncharacterized protein LOC122243691 isoform X2 n=1 Tax=Penaeus japonicus TaxID=27405 RepID=UPI001C717AFB|nr:uncharacterized protein LOC122243691 isoform X2 [Penaeus japonicus]